METWNEVSHRWEYEHGDWPENWRADNAHDPEVVAIIDAVQGGPPLRYREHGGGAEPLVRFYRLPTAYH